MRRPNESTIGAEGTTHVCGRCGNAFSSEDSYLSHVCIGTGVVPTDPRSMGVAHEAIQRAALERGKQRKQE